METGVNALFVFPSAQTPFVKESNRVRYLSSYIYIYIFIYKYGKCPSARYWFFALEIRGRVFFLFSAAAISYYGAKRAIGSFIIILRSFQKNHSGRFIENIERIKCYDRKLNSM